MSKTIPESVRRPIEGDKLFTATYTFNNSSEHEHHAKKYWWGRSLRDVRKQIADHLLGDGWEYDPGYSCWEQLWPTYNLLNFEVVEFGGIDIENGDPLIGMDLAYYLEQKELDAIKQQVGL